MSATTANLSHREAFAYSEMKLWQRVAKASTQKADKQRARAFASDNAANVPAEWRGK